MLKALIFDVDGTLADTEAAHRAAFNEAFAQEGMDWDWDLPLYTQLLQVSGGKERMLHYWKSTRSSVRDIDGTGVQDTLNRLHERKTAAYEAMVNGGAVSLRPGVLDLINAAGKAGLMMAIATTTSPVNIAALLRSALGKDWPHAFSVIEDASTAPLTKPHPQAYLQTLQRLRLPASQCLAFEDSANGLQAATGAGLATLVTPNSFTAQHDFSGALRVLPDLTGTTVAQLRAWHAEAMAPQTAPVRI